MRLIFTISLMSNLLFSSNLSKLYSLYENQKYDKACNYANKYFYKKKNKNSENYLTLYGLSCLETNNIDRVAVPMTRLTKSEDARANANYFGTILLQKQLLLQAILDKKPLGDLILPKTNFIISKIFRLFLEEKYRLEENTYIFKDKELLYKLYIKRVRRGDRYMVIDIYKDDKFTKRYQYK